MTLSSQRTRVTPIRGAGASYRRGAKPWLAIAVVIILAVVAYRFLVSHDGSAGNLSLQSTQAANQLAAAGTNNAAPPQRTYQAGTGPLPATSRNPTPTATPAPPPAQSQTNTVTFGSPAPGSAPAPGSTSTATAGSTTASIPSGVAGNTPGNNSPVSLQAGPERRESPGSGTPANTPAPPAAGAAATAGQPTTAPSNTAARPEAFRQGMSLIEQGQLIRGREVLSRLFFSPDNHLSLADSQAIRDTLNSINRELVFSPRVTAGDPVVETYVIQPGDVLARLAPRYKITYQLLQKINQANPRRLYVGQQLKVIKGPLHAIVYKHLFMMDIYAVTADNQRLFISSFSVGLGKEDSTPIGSWRVKPSGKLENPAWTHPATNHYYAPDDPQNPIGEYWIALEGTEDLTRGRNGYGIHGTIEPQSIGQQMSMGCVRLRPADIAQVYELLVDGDSTVEIRP